MSKPTITAHALSHIAGEVAALGKRPATEVAYRIVERLKNAGLVIVPASQPDAMKVLILLNSAFDLSGADIEGADIEGLSEILASLPPVPENLAA